MTFEKSSSISEFVLQNLEQVCIPVGCVPAAHWPYAAVCFPGWGCLPGPGGGLPAQGGFSLPGGVSAWSGGALPARRPPPVNRITHTCKNITLATTSLRPVIKLYAYVYTYTLLDQVVMVWIVVNVSISESME